MSTPEKTPRPGKERMADYRRRMRAKGLRPVQRWVLDTRNPEVLARIEKAIAAINADTKGEAEIMAWIEQVYEWPDS
jgi:hypothetical protein